MKKLVLCSILAFMLLSCDNKVVNGLDSVMNYPGAVITGNSWEGGKYYFVMLRRNMYSSSYEYIKVPVSRYEFMRYNVGDTIPETQNNSPKNKDE